MDFSSKADCPCRGRSEESSPGCGDKVFETVRVCEENFVEGLAGVNISLRLLDCRRAGCNWHARSGRLELNDGRRHLENLDEVLVGRILISGMW